MLLVRLDGGCTSATAGRDHTTVAQTTGAIGAGTDRGAQRSHGIQCIGFGDGGQGNGKIYGLKEETHAARWGLLRGYSGKATKWVDFVCDRLNPKGVLPLV